MARPLGWCPVCGTEDVKMDDCHGELVELLDQFGRAITPCPSPIPDPEDEEGYDDWTNTLNEWAHRILHNKEEEE